MQHDELLTFEDLCVPDIPVRSRLHTLPPIGIGTALVESLTGYISRLACSYGVTTGTLVTREISYVIRNGIPKQGDDSTYTCEKSSGQTINGVSEASKNWADALEKLTGIHSLEDLTLLRWSPVLPPQRLLRVTRAWCPECYQFAAENGMDPHDQLLWSILSVMACPIHRKTLLFACPHCGTKKPMLAWRTSPGFCANCNQWLGSIRKCSDASVWDIWRADVIGQLLSAGPNFAVVPRMEDFPQAFWTFARKSGFHKICPLARFLGFGRDTVNDWIHEGRKPNIDSLLVICAKLGATPLSILTNNTNLEENHSEITESAVPLRPPLVVHRIADAERLILEAIQKGSPMDSISQVCKRAGVPRLRLTKNFPEIGKRVKERRKQFLAEKRVKKREDFLENIKQTIAVFRSEGRFFTRAHVANSLARRGMLRSAQGRTIFDQVLDEEKIPRLAKK